MVTLALVRHGETVGNSSVRYHGRTDVELSDLGRAADACRSALAEYSSERFPARPIVASPLRRAAEGASIIAGGEVR